MYRATDDFLRSWNHEAKATQSVFDRLTDESLEQRVTPDGRSLGQLAWHITLSLVEMGEKAGLRLGGPGEDAPAPTSAAAIREIYAGCAAALAEQVASSWPDDRLPEEIDMYGERWTRGNTLAILINHQAHHRGQMTVLMRQAGLRVPGVYGPAKEEWAGFGMPAPW